MKKLFTSEQAAEIIKLGADGHRESIVAFGSYKWNQGYYRGVLFAGISTISAAALCYAFDWFRMRH